MRTNTYTQNMSPAYESTGNAVLDYFAYAGTSRNNLRRAADLFIASLRQDAETTLKLMFYFRDPRRGQGERAVFETSLKILAMISPDAASYLLPLVPEYGRWDDLFALADTPAYVSALRLMGYAILDNDRLAAKWAPREKSANRDIARSLRQVMGLSPKRYRKLIASVSDTVEQEMSAGNWATINFSGVPSQAMSKYYKAFYRHQTERFDAWKNAVRQNVGDAKVNTATLLPHQIVQKVWEVGSSYVREDDTLELLWENLPELIDGEMDILPVIDVSGSMLSPKISGSLVPMHVSVGLGLYLSERLTGVWHDKFITFSRRPQVNTLKSGSVATRMGQVLGADWGANTNIDAVMELLLNTREMVGTDVLPSTVLIISDMQFDAAGRDRWGGSLGTNFENMVRQFNSRGITPPRFIWWNVSSQANTNFQFTEHNTMGVQTAYVSGFSPVVLNQVLNDGRVSPMEVVMDTVNQEWLDKVELPIDLLSEVQSHAHGVAVNQEAW